MMGNANLTKSVDKAEAVLNRAVYEDFLYLEAQLLDVLPFDLCVTKALRRCTPRSHTSRLISNTRILGSDDSGVHLRSAFVTHRSKGKTTDMFCGHHLHTVKMVDGELKIVAKRSMLDLANLRPQGRVSIIL